MENSDDFFYIGKSKTFSDANLSSPWLIIFKDGEVWSYSHYWWSKDDAQNFLNKNWRWILDQRFEKEILEIKPINDL